jgi:hypothetical protein
MLETGAECVFFNKGDSTVSCEQDLPTSLSALCPAVSFTPTFEEGTERPRLKETRLRSQRLRLSIERSCFCMLVFMLCQSTFADIRITELNYNPPADGIIPGDAFQFIEIKNTGSSAVTLSGANFISGISYAFPGTTTIGANALIVLVSDATAFAKRYPTVTPGGVFAKHLAKSGESIKLVSSSGTKIDSMTYSDKAPWPVAAAGSGFTLVPKNSSPVGDASAPAYWRASTKLYGSPGADDPASPAIADVVISEVLAHTDWPQVDAVELYNPTAAAVNIGGWCLTDNFSKPTKYRFPGTTTIPANGYLVVYSDNDTVKTNNASLPPEFFGADFALSCNGEEIYLFSADASGNLTGYSDGFNYDASENGVSFGRYVSNDGSISYPSQTASTLGSVNAGPRVGPIVISEIMHTPRNGCEFVELTNISANEVQLYDHERPANTWKTTNLSAFTFPLGMTMKGGEIVLLVSDTIPPADFRRLNSIPDAVRILTFIGRIASGQTISIKKPLIPFVNDSGQTEIPYEVVDKVAYRNSLPWPAGANGTGPSIERIQPALYGNDPANWRASTAAGGTPGSIVLAKVRPYRQYRRSSPMRVTGVNPRTGYVMVRLFSPVGFDGILKLVDLKGRTIDRVALGPGKGEMHDIRLTTPVGCSGILVCHLTTSAGVQTTIPVLMHR